MHRNGAATLSALALLVTTRLAGAEDASPGAGLFSGWKTTHLGDEGLTVFVGPSTTILAPNNRVAVGMLGGFHAQIYGDSWYPGPWETWRFLFDGSLGLDSRGALGGLAHEGAFGLRLPLPLGEESAHVERSALYPSLDADLKSSLSAVFTNATHALIARAGYALRFGGDNLAYSSVIELPRLELGWQMEGGFGFDSFGAELRAHAAPALVGRHDVQGGSRGLGGSLAWGGHLHAGDSKAGEAEADFTRYELTDGAVHVVDARACARVGPRDKDYGYRKFALCTRQRLDEGRVFRQDGSSFVGVAFASTLTLSVGGR